MHILRCALRYYFEHMLQVWRHTRKTQSAPAIPRPAYPLEIPESPELRTRPARSRWLPGARGEPQRRARVRPTPGAGKCKQTPPQHKVGFANVTLQQTPGARTIKPPADHAMPCIPGEQCFGNCTPGTHHLCSRCSLLACAVAPLLLGAHVHLAMIRCLRRVWAITAPLQKGAPHHHEGCTQV